MRLDLFQGLEKGMTDARKAAFYESNLHKTPPIECDLEVGDTVTFTNYYGVVFPGKKVMGFSLEEEIFNERFIYIDTDCYWFPTHRGSLKLTKRAKS